MKKSHAFYKALAENTPEGIIIADSDTRDFIYVNPTICRMLGYEEHELLEMNVSDIHPEESLEYVFSCFKKQISGEDSLASALPCITRSGEIFYVDVSAAPIETEEGEFIVGFFTDVTDRKIAEEKQMREEVKYLELVNHLPVGILRIDTEGKYVFINKTIEEWSGKKAEDVIGKRPDLYKGIFHPEDISVLFGKSFEFLDKIISETNEIRMRKAGGDWGWYLQFTYPWHNPDGSIGGTEAILLDITSEKEYLDEIERSEEKYHKIFNSTNDIIIINEIESGRVIDANRSAVETSGFSLEEMKEMRLLDVTPRRAEFDPKKMMEYARETVKGNPQRFDWAYIDKTGGEHQVDVILHKTRISGSDYILTIARDITEKIRNKKILIESELKYRTLFESTLNGIFIQDLGGNIIDANPSMQTILGGSREEIIGTSVFKYMHEEDADRALIAMKDCVENGFRDADDQFEITNMTGRKLNVLINGTLLLDEGKPYAIMGNARDITKEVKLQKELREASQNWEKTFDAIQDMVSILDNDNKVIKANAAMHTMFEDAEEIIGQSCNDIFHEGGCVPTGCPCVEAKTRKNMAKLQIQENKLGGKWIEIHAYPILDENENVNKVVHVVRDITENKMLEEALQNSLDRIKAVVDNNPVGLYRNTPGREGSFIMVNPALARMHGYESPEEILKVPVSSLYVVPEERHRISKKLEELGEIVNEEVLLKRKDGTHFWGSLTAKAFRNALEEMDFYDGMIEDVTEKRRMKESIEKKEHQLTELSHQLIMTQEEERHKLSREFHDDVGQLLATMSMEVEWLRETGEREPENFDTLTQIIRQISNSVRRICMGLHPIIIEELGLSAAIRDYVQKLDERTSVKFHDDIENIELDDLDQIGVVNIYRILQESITNAIRHSKGKNVHVEFKIKDENICLEVSDDGVGFDEEKLDHMFGLIGMQERAVVCGGKVTVKSEPGNGTCVMLRIPLSYLRKDGRK